MLDEKKMMLGQKKIQFLEMNIADGQYKPKPHVAQELLKYLEESLSKKVDQKEIQQFLGLLIT